MAWINGTNFSDLLNGSNENDVIQSFGGNDTISGEDGDDYIYGGAGLDNIVGDNVLCREDLADEVSRSWGVRWFECPVKFAQTGSAVEKWFLP